MTVGNQHRRTTVRLLTAFVIGFVALTLEIAHRLGLPAVAMALVVLAVARGRLVAWSWAVNGFFSVLGASLTTLISMAFGFDRAVLAGLVLYGLATAVRTVGLAAQGTDGVLGAESDELVEPALERSPSSLTAAR